MSEKLFRKNALNKVNNPDNLNDIICVTNPGVWIVIAALMILLAGALFWAILGEVENTMPVSMRVKDGEGTIRMTIQDSDKVHVGDVVRVGMNNSPHVTGILYDDDYTSAIIYVDADSIMDCTISAEIITGYFHPIELITN